MLSKFLCDFPMDNHARSCQLFQHSHLHTKFIVWVNTKRQTTYLRPLYGWESPRAVPSRRHHSSEVLTLSFHCCSGPGICMVFGQSRVHSYYPKAYSSCQMCDIVQVQNCLQSIWRSKPLVELFSAIVAEISFFSKRFMGPSYAAHITFIYLLYLRSSPPCNV